MDKNKIIEAAAKLVQKGAYDKAIKEYQKVLDADPKDVRVLQKMGELYQKKNENGLAATFFSRVAETYAGDGFFLKAVALYKQVLKLSPGLVEVNLKLAELHQQLGLISEAMAYFQIVANHYDKVGDTKSSLDTLKRMVDLDPENVASRIKLAELYARENLRENAVEEFRRSAEYLKRHNRTEDYLRVCERITALVPEDVVLARELASTYLQKGDQKRALAKLQLCFKADPRDIPTLELLAEAFQGLGQTSKTLSVYKELAKIYGEANQTELAQGVWNKVAILDPHDPDVMARRGPVAAPPSPAAPAPAPAAASAASSGNAKPSPARQPAPQTAPAAAAPGRENLAKLLTETDVYVKYGLHDKALDHLRKVFSVDPENLDAHEKAYQIYVSANHNKEASDQLLNVLRLMTRRGEVDRAQPYLRTMLQRHADHPEVPAFLAVLQRAGEDLSSPEPLAEDAILVDAGDEEIIVAEAPADALQVGADDLALVSTELEEEVVDDALVLTSDEEALSEEPRTLVTPPPAADEWPSAELEIETEGDVVSDEDSGFGDTDGGFEDEPFGQAEEPAPAPPPPAAPSRKTQTFGAVNPPPPAATKPAAAPPKAIVPPAAKPPPAAPPPAAKAAPRPAAAKPPPAAPPARSAPSAPPAKPAPAPIAVAPTPRAAPSPVARAAPAPVPVPVPVRAPEPQLDDSVAQEVEEAGFLLEQGLLEEARDILETVLIAHPNHARAQELLAGLEAASQATTSPGMTLEPESNAFDLAAELAEEVGELGEEAGVAIEPAGDDFQYSVEEVFEEFKKGLEKVVKPEDVETHYDLGIAYKEMGLLDDAIGEFNVARQGCMKKRKEVDCLTMMGMLQGMKGDHTAAVSSYQQALTSEFAVGETAKSLEFELGQAWEAGGNPEKALVHFQKVASEDPSYRGVGEILARLKSAPKSRKVGYL